MQIAEKISITIMPDQLRAVRESIETGEYASASEVLRDALRLWQRQEDAAQLNVIRSRVRSSLDDPRPSIGFEEVDAHLEKLFRQAEGDARRAKAAR